MRRVVQSELNAIAITLDIGPAIQKIRVIFVVSKDSITAFKRFTKKEAVLDARICPDSRLLLIQISFMKLRMLLITNQLGWLPTYPQQAAATCPALPSGYNVHLKPLSPLGIAPQCTDCRLLVCQTYQRKPECPCHLTSPQ